MAGDGVLATSYRRPKRGTRPASDVRLDSPSLGAGIAECLRVKGFCLINDVLGEDVLDEAVAAFDGEAVEFYQPAVLVQEGLLGMEGSQRVAKMESGEGSSNAGLRNVDEIITRLANAVGPHQGEIGFRCAARSGLVFHEATEPSIEEADLTDHEANEWCSLFMSRKIMVVVFLGPDRGTLELTPYDEDANPTDLSTFPGQAVLVRTDQLSFKFTTRGSKANYSATSFLIQSDILSMHRVRVDEHMVPAARDLETWIESRLRDLKENEADEPDWCELEEKIPRNFLAAANRMYFKKTQTAIRGCAAREPTCWEPEVFAMACMAGVDTPTEVPFCRWDHSSVYDPAPDSWKQQPAKTSCRHASFIEGIELFDNKMFALSIAEVKGMDPAQRQVLECTYEALFRSGMKKSTLTNSNTGMYVGMGTSEWNFAERSADVGIFGATGGAPSICAGRLSFCLGCKGASLAIDTEAASGLSSLFFAAESVEKKGSGYVQDLACGIGVHLVVAKAWWPAMSAAGFLSTEGRCMSFDASADGFVRSEAVSCMVVRNKPETVVDGEQVTDDMPLVGTICGGATMNAGMSAGMTAPNGPSEQACLLEACRKSGIMPYDVDIVECHGAGKLIADAVEVASCGKALRSGTTEEMLQLTSKKANIGNSMETSGLAGLAKMLHSMRWGFVIGNQHLRQLNPHLDLGETPVLVADENLEQRTQVFTGVSAHGFGGTHVHIHLFGGVDEDVRPPPEPTPEELRPKLTYWPSGGGHLEMSSRPRKGFFIIGTWNSWQPEQMTDEGEGCYSSIVTVGENRWEQFQIMIDGEESKLLHPPFYKAPKGTEVIGPVPSSEVEKSRTWLIDGEQVGLDADAQPAIASSEGVGCKPGDRYSVNLHVAGKWRTVTWSKLEAEAGAVVPMSFGRYFVAGSWSDFAFEEMAADSSTPGVFRHQVKLEQFGGAEFQIVRNRDWSQTISPTSAHAGAEAAIHGPDDRYEGFNWHMDGQPGDVFIIEFQRSVAAGVDTKKVTWRKSS